MKRFLLLIKHAPLTGCRTEGEFERRQRLIDGLTSKRVQIEDAFSGREEGGDRWENIFWVV